MKHFTIPIFIPEAACPFQCTFCNQTKISGQTNYPSPDEVKKTIEKHLATIPAENSTIEIGFFGGTFTGIPLNEQENFLSTANDYFDKNISGIRLSTRPDYINDEVISFLKKYNVTTVELGAQSLDNFVLKKSGRGHTAEDVAAAAEKIKSAGINLGLQMMIGLPGDTLERAIYTAEKIVQLGAENTRIYPSLVIKDTALHRLYSAGKYTPLSLDEAVEWTKHIYKIFENKVTVLRVGLHPSDGLLGGDELVAGPFHVSFKELVLSSLWNDELAAIKNGFDKITIEVNPGEINYAAGYNSVNKKMLKQKFKTVKFKVNPQLTGRNFNVIYS